MKIGKNSWKWVNMGRSFLCKTSLKIYEKLEKSANISKF